MTSNNTFRQFGQTGALVAALAIVPLGASAMVSKHDINPRTAVGSADGGNVSLQRKHTSDNYIFVPKVGYVRINNDGAGSGTGSGGHAYPAGFVFVPKVGYVKIRADS